jgi:hypothetical protein
MTPRRLRRAARWCALAPLLVAAGCGGGGGSPDVPTIQAARVFKVVDFTPAGSIAAAKPATVSFTIQQPDGTPLTAFKRGPGPHTGVHLIYVRDDLTAIVHHHPPVGTGAKIDDRVTFPAPGPYRLVIDVYPAACSGSAPSVPGAPARTCNFQLFENVRVAGPYKPQPLPATSQAQTVDGFRFALAGAAHLTAIQAQLVRVGVTAPGGKPASFQTYYGALAHAIFFRKGSLDYFHTHVCAPGASGCTSFLGGAQVTGTSSTPGRLTVGVLVPVAGTWRLFLQVEVGGRVLTAPFTLHVR